MPFQNNRTRFITGENAKPLDHYYSTEDIAPNEQTRMTKKKTFQKNMCEESLTHWLKRGKKKNAHKNNVSRIIKNVNFDELRHKCGKC